MPLSLVYRQFSLKRCCRYISITLLIAWAFNIQASSTEETLYLGNSGEPGTLDPHRYNLRLEETLLNDLFMGLTTFSAQGQIVPGAATQLDSQRRRPDLDLQLAQTLTLVRWYSTHSR